MATTADVPQTGICVGAVVQASPHAWGAHYAEKVGAAKRFRGTVVEAGTELELPESCPAPLSSREPIWRVRYDDDGKVWATPERFLKVAARLRSGDNAAPAPVAAPPPPAPAPADLTPQQRFGSLGGKCAGSVGENKFLVEVAVDGRARCQLRTCKEPLKVGELRLGKRPPSLRHGHKPKVTWYHPECAMEAFRGCSKKSRVVEKVEDIDHGWGDLSDTNKAFIRSVVDNAAKSRAPRKITPPAAAAAAHPLAALGDAMVGAVHTAASFEARSGCLAAPSRPFAAYAFLASLRSSGKSDAFKRILAGAGTDLAAMRRRVTRLLCDDLDILEDFHHLTRHDRPPLSRGGISWINPATGT